MVSTLYYQSYSLWCFLKSILFKGPSVRNLQCKFCYSSWRIHLPYSEMRHKVLGWFSFTSTCSDRPLWIYQNKLWYIHCIFISFNYVPSTVLSSEDAEMKCERIHVLKGVNALHRWLTIILASDKISLFSRNFRTKRNLNITESKPKWEKRGPQNVFACKQDYSPISWEQEDTLSDASL